MAELAYRTSRRAVSRQRRFFLAKSLELRPAVPASSLLVGAVLLALSGVRRFESGKPGASFRWFSSGLALGAATMVTQKILFVGPGFAAVAVWFVLDRHLAGTWNRRLRLVVLQTVGFVLPIAFTLGYFASRGALWGIHRLQPDHQYQMARLGGGAFSR